MKIIKYLMVFIPLVANANSMEFIIGGITTHLVGNSERVASKYKNKINNRGILKNPIYAIKFANKDKTQSGLALTYLVGQNSVGGPMSGLVFSKFKKYQKAELSFAIGGYLQNTLDFKKVGLKPAAVGSFVPIIGIEVNFYLINDKKWFLKQNNLLTPIVTNHNLSLGINL